MMHPADLPETVSVFPLPGALLLPRSRLPLHIFEPRYLQMLDDALKTQERLIGMVQPNPCKSNEGKLHQIGCAGRVTQFSETEDGRYLITLTGISRFRIRSELDAFTPYRRCVVSWEGFDRDLGKVETDKGFDRKQFMNLLERFFASRHLSTDWDTLKDAEDELLVNSLSMLLDFDPEEKQALLEAPCLRTRRETLVTLIEIAMRGGTNEEKLQ
ncbi:LON peptidase substrate-binding domain-containing protein [Ruegeria profundi]|uniref:ATP-dependent protease n=1 Tax=Ruegeria profundi TaxID=1685378 RepID=A0A0X3TWV6_9RHOB|nr:LON peptidase substrate-binding domain-containing protein [Ruegeria profundi]KUJ79026.1 ATP-dependent protease [Ruegeria profundi]MCA0929311.1 LON peptidase substrate-binding domain-containing protein [Ruegeria profundi]